MSQQSLPRVVQAFGALAVAVGFAACSDAQVPAQGPTGTSESAMTAPFTRPGIIRPPRVGATTPSRADTENHLPASYPATGGCGSPLVYYGGPIIADPIVVQVSWNDPVTSGIVPSTVETYLQSWWPAILSPQAGYLAWLTEYDTLGVNGKDGLAGSGQTFSGHGTYAGVYPITPSVANQGATLSDAAIAAELVAQLSAGALPAPTFDASGNCNTIYMIDFPPSVTSISLAFAGTTGYSCTDFCGYHGGTAYQSNYIYYGVMPDVTSACTSCAPDGVDQDLGLLHSHELGEAMTDAQIDREALTATSADFMRPGGWDQWASGCSEIGDSCAWPAQAGSALPTVTYSGTQYYVQGLFDNSRMDCEVSGSTTAGCTTSATCTNPNLPVCKASACVACSVDSDCVGNASGSACQPSGACGQCSATNTSACVSPTSVCSTATGTCVGCATNANCSGAAPICDAFTSTCRACQASDCFSPMPACATSGSQSGQCVECTTNSQCSTSLPICDPSSDTCIGGCSLDSDCAGDTPICDTTSHMCRACVTNVDCAATTNHVCDIVSGGCVACAKSSDCATGTCDTTTHTCVQCTSDSECSNPKPICQTSGTTGCRPCVSDGECASSASGHLCSNGSCLQCRSSSDCPNGQSCNPTTHACGSAGGDGGRPAEDGGGVDGSSGGEGGSGEGGAGGGSGSSGGCAIGAGTNSSSEVTGGLLVGLVILARRRRR